MDWITNWDDIIHGTAVFSAAVPFCTALLLAWILPPRLLWIAVAAGVTLPFFWFFGFPEAPLDSDEAITAGLILAVLLVMAGSVFALKAWLRVTMRVLLWTGLAWLFYPKWLSVDGAVSKQILITAGMGVSITAWAMLMEFMCDKEDERTKRLTISVLIPPAIALAVILQLGGALQFGQSAGALAATVGALALFVIWRSEKSSGAPAIADLWAMLFGLLAWSGWLFAEIHKPAALVLVAAPLLVLTVKWLPLPRKNAFLVHLWDGLASALIAGIGVWLAWAEYSAASAGSEGY